MSKEPKQRSFKLERARWIAEELVRALAPAVHRIEIAGSVRRGIALVHDIDLVAWPVREEMVSANLFGEVAITYGGPGTLATAIESITKGVIHSNPESKILHFAYNEIPVEVYLAEPDGSNFEALWQMRTGSANHNAWLARRAISMHLMYKAGYGIFTLAGQRVDDQTESGIYGALNLPYPAPENRI